MILELEHSNFNYINKFNVHLNLSVECVREEGTYMFESLTEFW